MKLAVVAIRAEVVVVVFDDHQIAVAEQAAAGVHHPAGRSRLHRLAEAAADVDAFGPGITVVIAMPQRAGSRPAPFNGCGRTGDHRTPLGQPVQAAAAGRVVYAGSGLLNYGNLVIIKHDDNYLSAYGYNRQLRVQEGDEVRAGQTIADMGSKSDGEILLHFQIRYDGRPINPLLYLPKIRP